MYNPSGSGHLGEDPHAHRATRPRCERLSRHLPYTARMKDADVEPFFATLRAANPLPTTELEFTTPFELLVAVLLSAQATDAGVNKATRKLFPKANTPAAILALGQDGLEDHIKTIGLYHSKAKHLMETCRMLVERHGGKVPRSREELEALPGVGRKTANVVLNVAFGEEAMAVDTHIFRVSNRTGLAPGNTPREVEDRLMQRVPKDYRVDAHHWLILHGRYVCVARTPKCWECAVIQYCDYQPKTPPPGATAPAQRR
jgi:endonuclease III